MRIPHASVNIEDPMCRNKDQTLSDKVKKTELEESSFLTLDHNTKL